MKRPRRFSLVELFVIIGLIALIISIVMLSYHRMQQTSSQVPCATHLRQIGQALLLYSREHGNGRYPSQLQELKIYLSDVPLVCAETGKPAIFVRPAALEKGLTANDVVVYEPHSVSNVEGSNVLFGDGHTEWVGAEELNQMLARPSTHPTTDISAQE